ncbi:hypothetical protein [Streptomyces sp. NPDC007088]|uniref:hypothetical protein n=1 Tax=Streptomyces sp. NPDC007088 TaxID=3364773 RepID=UPI0036B57E44
MIGEFHVTVQFAEGGPAVTGTWTSEATALRKFREFIGSHGSMEGVTITLWEGTVRGWTRLQPWSPETPEARS